MNALFEAPVILVGGDVKLFYKFVLGALSILSLNSFSNYCMLMCNVSNLFNRDNAA